jgi:competence protein ComEA
MQFDRRLVLVVLLAGAAALVLAGRFLPGSSAPAPEPAPAVSVSTGGPPALSEVAHGPVTVHVVGAVRHPGVYRLPAVALAMRCAAPAGPAHGPTCRR